MANNHPQRNKPNPTFVSLESSWSGPLPPPQTLIQFEEAHPGSAKIIMDSFNEQSKHRRELEKIVIPANVAKEKRGQIMGFIIALFGMALGTTCILLGHDIAGATIAGVDLVAIVTVFVIGKTKQAKNLEKKENIRPR